MIEFQHDGKTYAFINVMQEIVFDKVRASINKDEDMCKCEKCYYDVCAIVLNALAPRYATSSKGAVISRADSSMNVSAASIISVEVIKAINLVKTRPAH